MLRHTSGARKCSSIFTPLSCLPVSIYLQIWLAVAFGVEHTLVVKSLRQLFPLVFYTVVQFSTTFLPFYPHPMSFPTRGPYLAFTYVFHRDSLQFALQSPALQPRPSSVSENGLGLSCDFSLLSVEFSTFS